MALLRNGIVRALSLGYSGKSPKLQNNCVQILSVQRQQEDGRRHLFSSEILGLENYSRQKASLIERMGPVKEKFFKRMDDYMKASDSNTIFTDDVKTMVYFAESDAELDTGVQMLKRFHIQNKDLRFSNFVFGPLVLRLLYVLKKPDVAFELFTDKNLTGFFDQMSSFVVLMDLLFENQQYERVLTIMDVVKDRQLNGFKFPMDCVTLTIASCYQMNTAESLQKAMNLLKETGGTSTNVSMRCAVYAAMLALKQGKADVAWEMLSMASLRNGTLPVAYVNTKLLILSRLGRLEDAVDELKAIIQQDIPDHVSRGGEVFDEVLKQICEAVSKDGTKDLKHRLETVEKALRQENHVMTGETFDAYILRPILRQRRIQDGYKQRDRAPVAGFRRPPPVRQNSRPGLLD